MKKHEINIYIFEPSLNKNYKVFLEIKKGVRHLWSTC